MKYGNDYKIKESLYNDDPVIRTYTGKYVNIFDMKKEDIDIVDIAWRLSNTCRFGGYTKIFYSVAQHSNWCCEHIENDSFKLEALMHDATEAYIGDIPSPIKRVLVEIGQIEDRIQEIIADKFKLKCPFPKEVHAIDRKALEYEWDNFMISEHIVQIGNIRDKSGMYKFMDNFNKLKRT